MLTEVRGACFIMTLRPRCLMRQPIACCLVSESMVVLRMQAMQQTTARELFRDRVLLDKLCNNPQDFLLDIRHVAALWTVLFGRFTLDCVALAASAWPHGAREASALCPRHLRSDGGSASQQAAECAAHQITSQVDDPLLAAVHDAVALPGEPGGSGDGAAASRDASPAAASPQVIAVPAACRHLCIICEDDDPVWTMHIPRQQGSDAEDDFAEPDGSGKPAGGTKAVKAKTKQKPLPPGSLSSWQTAAGHPALKILTDSDSVNTKIV